MSKDTITWLKSLECKNDLARSLIESSSLDETNPQIAQLIARAAIGPGIYSQRLKAMFFAKDSLVFNEGKSDAKHRAKVRLFERVRQHNPATRPTPAAMRLSEDFYDRRSNECDLPPQSPFMQVAESKPPSQGKHHQCRAMSFEGLSLDGYLVPTRAGPWVNPFLPTAPPARPLRSSLLSGNEVIKLYDGLSFAMLEHGVTMNVHVIIVWSMMGVDPVEGGKRLGKFLNEATKWMRIGMEPRWRRVKNQRDGAELHYAWIHEHAPSRGFHSHILMNVPVGLIKEFGAWSRACLLRYHGANFPYDAVRVVRSYAKTRDAAVKRHWRWFQYLTKELDPRAELVTKHPARGVATCSLREVIKPFPIRKGLAVPQIKMSGVSHSIGKASQLKSGFTSALSTGDLGGLFNGDELEKREWLKLCGTLVV